MRMKELLKIDEEDHTQSQEGLHTWWEKWFQTPPRLVWICAEKNFAHALRTYVNIFVLPGAQNFYGARGTELCDVRGTELLWHQGHRTFVVPGAHVACIATTAVLDPVRSAKIFIFCHDPSLDQSWGPLILVIILLLLNCNYLTNLCTFQGFKSFKVLINISTNFLSMPIAWCVLTYSKPC